MFYGMISAGSCKLTEISRELKEDIEIKKTVERLGRNLANFTDTETIMDNYMQTVKKHFDKDTMLLVDPSDVVKPCSKEMEAIGTVYDGSEGRFASGYWTIGVAALSKHNNQPIPVYENLYPCKKQGGAGLAAEGAKALDYLREHFDDDCPRVFDKGQDTKWVFAEVRNTDIKYIIRANQNRLVLHNGEKTYTEDVARNIECTYEMKYEDRNGRIRLCKIGSTQVTIKNEKITTNLVVCRIHNEKPLILYTNLDETMETFGMRVVKAYLKRWRIEEMYAFKKQKFNFEDFRVRSLTAMKALDIFLTVIIGYIGILSEKIDYDDTVIRLVIASKRVQKYKKYIESTKFYYYAIFDGIHAVLSKLRSGIRRLTAPPPPRGPYQLCFSDEILGYL